MHVWVLLCVWVRMSLKENIISAPMQECVCVCYHVCDRVSTAPNCGPGAPNGHYDVQQCDISAIYGQVACPCTIVCRVNLSRLPFFFFSKTPCFTLTGTLCGCLLWSNGRCLSLGVCAWLMTQCWWHHTEWGAHRVILKWHSGGTWACICVFAVCTAPLEAEVTRARLGLVVLTQTQSPGGSLTGNNSVWTDPSAHAPTFHWINVGFCLVSGVHFSLGKRPVDLSCPHHSMALSLLQVNK